MVANKVNVVVARVPPSAVVAACLEAASNDAARLAISGRQEGLRQFPFFEDRSPTPSVHAGPSCRTTASRRGYRRGRSRAWHPARRRSTSRRLTTVRARDSDGPPPPHWHSSERSAEHAARLSGRGLAAHTRDPLGEEARRE